MSTLSYTSANGFFYKDVTGKFVSPGFDSYKLAQSLIQIKPVDKYFAIFVMKINDTITDNEEWKKYVKYLYLAAEPRLLFGNSHQTPSAVNLKPLKVFQLRDKVAEQLITTNLLYLSERDYKDVSAIVKPEYINNFKYEMPGIVIDTPNTNIPKQSSMYRPKPTRKVS